MLACAVCHVCLACRPIPAKAAVPKSQRATGTNIHRKLESLSSLSTETNELLLRTAIGLHDRVSSTRNSVQNSRKARRIPIRVCLEGIDSCTICIPILFGFYVRSTLKMRSFAGQCNATTKQSTETGRVQSKCTGGGITSSGRADGAAELFIRLDRTQKPAGT